MAAPSVRQWGVTPPISLNLPTSEELKANETLIEELNRQNNFEGPDESAKRSVTLQLIQKITSAFVKHVSTKKNLPKSSVESAGGKVFTFGSYRLGVYGPGSDIDTLVVAPKHVNRDDFFEDLPGILINMAPPGAVQELTPVPDAFVPIIKLKFSNISIDLIFARLEVSSVPLSLTLKDNNLLRGLDERDLRSLNGTRVTDEILELVPQEKTFRTALRCIKLWAQRRAIYANIMGFPGGVAWAMLVARVCQLYPQATGSVVVGKFFHIIRKWSWPQPILLKQIEEGPLQVKVWNPKIYPSDRYHLMPIITPAYPSMCATHNITSSTKRIILSELERGQKITDNIWSGKMQWRDLFAKHSFFVDGFKYYISIIAASRTEGAQHVWSGLVESKVRLLVGSLGDQPTIELARPFNKGFERVHNCRNEEEIEAVINGELKYQAPNTRTETTDNVNDPKHAAAAAEGGAETMAIPNEVEESTANGAGVQKIYTTTYYIGIELSQAAQKSLNISYQTKEFKDTCTSWQGYDAEQNSLNIVHTRNYDLPDDVFTPGETRPRPKKKVMTKKRSHETADGGETPQQLNGTKRSKA